MHTPKEELLKHFKEVTNGRTTKQAVELLREHGFVPDKKRGHNDVYKNPHVDVTVQIPSKAINVALDVGKRVVEACELVNERSKKPAVELKSFEEAVFIPEAPEIRESVLIKTSQGEDVKTQKIEEATKRIFDIAAPYVTKLKAMESELGFEIVRDTARHTLTLQANDLRVTGSINYEEKEPAEIVAFVEKLEREAKGKLSEREQLVMDFAELGGQITEGFNQYIMLPPDGAAQPFYVDRFGPVGYLTSEGAATLKTEIAAFQARELEREKAKAQEPVPAPATPAKDGFWVTQILRNGEKSRPAPAREGQWEEIPPEKWDDKLFAEIAKQRKQGVVATVLQDGGSSTKLGTVTEAGKEAKQKLLDTFLKATGLKDKDELFDFLHVDKKIARPNILTQFLNPDDKVRPSATLTEDHVKSLKGKLEKCLKDAILKSEDKSVQRFRKSMLSKAMEAFDTVAGEIDRIDRGPTRRG